MSTAKGYSLWLMPSGESYNRLNSIISQLSRRHNAQYFEPHVTLMGEILGTEDELVSKTAKLSSLIQKYEIDLGKVEFLPEYFKCLFLRARESDKVMLANEVTRKVFGREHDPKYMPHLSLLYGDFSPTIKEEMIAKIGNDISIKFDVNSIHLFSTNGEPKDWYRVKEFSLK
ncbi:MAG TPA: 2'-5' RNA ligase family protein [Candidatus Nanoarchaeia archaeon]|nr:2'-5' RNA ligase family protein [Candidatus Nanoarchaeia archaeon]